MLKWVLTLTISVDVSKEFSLHGTRLSYKLCRQSFIFNSTMQETLKTFNICRLFCVSARLLFDFISRRSGKASSVTPRTRWHPFQIEWGLAPRFDLCTKKFKKHASIYFVQPAFVTKRSIDTRLGCLRFQFLRELFKSSFRMPQVVPALVWLINEAKIFSSSLLATLFDYEFIF